MKRRAIRSTVAFTERIAFDSTGNPAVLHVERKPLCVIRTEHLASHCNADAKTLHQAEDFHNVSEVEIAVLNHLGIPQIRLLHVSDRTTKMVDIVWRRRRWLH